MVYESLSTFPKLRKWLKILAKSTFELYTLNGWYELMVPKSYFSKDFKK